MSYFPSLPLVGTYAGHSVAPVVSLTRHAIAVLRLLPVYVLVVFLGLSASTYGQGNVIERTAGNTLTPVEMDKGDTLRFRLRNGEIRTLVLRETAVDVVITNLSELKKEQEPDGATLYRFTCTIEVDGHPMELERYVGSQESFYEPYVINGMRLWFDGVSALTEILLDIHGTRESVPNKHARFAIADMTDRIAPVQVEHWYPNTRNFIAISDCYNGANAWLGAQRGIMIHGGLDINFPPGTPNYAPIPVDDHYLFDSLQEGQRNNRWRGLREWENGHVWTIQNHHMLQLRVPEHTPIDAGIHYADAAGVSSGWVHHAHYMFRVKTPQDDREILLDPWILFWQSFEDNRDRSGGIRASMAPLAPANVGEAIGFRSDGSRSGVQHADLAHYWTFGDGGFSTDAAPHYAYARPGVYPVTLVVDDGAQKASFTQHVTIDGPGVKTPALTVAAKEEPSFRLRPIHALDVYGAPVRATPHGLRFVARATRPRPDEKIVVLRNRGGGELRNAEATIDYMEKKGWLSVVHEGDGNEQLFRVGVDATGMHAGVYSARVRVHVPRALNDVQEFVVRLTIPSHPPKHRSMRNYNPVDHRRCHAPYYGDYQVEVIHHSDMRAGRFYRTPYFWVGPQFYRWHASGYGDYYLTNGGRSRQGEFARFTPDLEEGIYQVALASETPFDPQQRVRVHEAQRPVNRELNPDPRFPVRVRSAEGDEVIWIRPTESTVIGTFRFHEGMDGFVDVLAEDSIGQVLVDAIVFTKLE